MLHITSNAATPLSGIETITYLSYTEITVESSEAAQRSRLAKEI
jgi:hypothetical protein